MLPDARRAISPALGAPLFAILFAAWSLCTTPRASPWAAAVNAGFLLVAFVVATVAHEAAHFGMARAVGLRPKSVFLGRGPVVWEGAAGDVRYFLQAVPFTGAVRVVAASPSRLRARLAAFYAAGPAANAVLLVAMLPLLSCDDLGRGLAQRPAPILTFAVVNVLMLLTNAVPLPSARAPTGLPVGMGTDGWQLCTVPFRSDADLEPLLMGFDLTGALHLVQERKLAEARALLDEASRNVSAAHAWRVRAVESDWALAAEDWPCLATVLTSLLGDADFAEKLAAPTRAMAANNLAWALFMLDDTARLAEADRWSAEALAILPDQASVLGTRGTVLVALGHLEEGERLLRRSFKLTKPRKARALSACALAVARAGRGAIADAERWIRDARGFDPECTLLARADAAVAASHRGTTA